MMARVVALHGSSGSGKSTLTRLIRGYLGNDCEIMEESLDEILATPSSPNDQASWYRQKTVISVNDKLIHLLIDRITPLSVLVSSLIFHFLIGTLWPVVVLFIVFLTISRFYRWFSSYMLSKMWLYNVFQFLHHQRKSDCQWIWRDRTCVDVYAYCLHEKITSVPSNMRSLLLEQTNATSVAIILDVPEHIIRKHLRARIHCPTTPRTMVFTTRLILLTEFTIHATIAALKLVERWYRKTNVPVIKISQIREKLDCDAETGEIQWNKRSISVLLEIIEETIKQRGPPISTIDESLIPW